MKNVLIIDYSMGNTDSMKRALEECDAKVEIGCDKKQFENASHLILPGVGSFYQGMINIKKRYIDEYIINETLKNKPLLGVCLGMQMLADRGTEGREVSGLGLIKGVVKIMQKKKPEDRIPHVGWNSVIYDKDNLLLKRIPSGKDFYFVHSYSMCCENDNNIIATTPYCMNITSVVNNDNTWGTQFHPEKSQFPGFQLLKNFLDL